MGMIGNKHPSITGRLGLRKQLSHAIQQVLSVFFVSKDFSTLYTPDHNVMKGTGRVKSG
jgi:hypothetical protein